MTVYEATTRKDYRKIVRFTHKQPHSRLIPWRRTHGAKSVETEGLKQRKDTLKCLHVFWCEDEKGEIRAVLSVRERMTEQNIPVATNACVIMNDWDWKSDNGVYFKELVDSIIRIEAPKYRLERGHFFGMKKFADWTKELCGETMKVVREIPSADVDPTRVKCAVDLGPIYEYVIDFNAYIKGLK